MHHKKRLLVPFIVIIFIIALSVIEINKVKNYLFPLKYEDIIMKYSKKYDVDPILVRAIINVESHYNTYAQSQKDAKGLMQITPSTGKWAAEKAGIKGFKEDMLFDPDINIMLGCWYLKNLDTEFKSDVVLMLAAYNGGGSNVKKWLQVKEYSETGKQLNNIPFKETERYVKKVLRHYKIYKWLCSMSK